MIKFKLKVCTQHYEYVEWFKANTLKAAILCAKLKYITALSVHLVEMEDY